MSVGWTPVRTIPLTRGYVATVDDEDYEQVSGHKWFAEVRPHAVYAKCMVRVNGAITTVYMHRVVVGAGPGEEVDHVNHDGLDNQRSNLRLCVGSQNQGNQRRRQGASSRYKGVTRDKQKGKWRTQIQLNGARRRLGRFTDEIEAAKAYDEAALFQWGEFACLNFSPVVYT